jgi:hypothetical protein
MPQAGRITPQAIAIGRGFDRPNARMPILRIKGRSHEQRGEKYVGNAKDLTLL